jgi:hypothetical protein
LGETLQVFADKSQSEPERQELEDLKEDREKFMKEVISIIVRVKLIEKGYYIWGIAKQNQA